MKTLIMILILGCFISPAFSQKKKSKSKKEKENPTWFSVSLGGGYGNSVFLNNNTMNDKNIDLSLFNPSYSIIGKVNANFNFGLGVALEFGTSGYSQNYKIISNINGDNKYEKVVNLKTFDKIILIRKISPTGGYIEIGPDFAGITSYPAETVHNQFKSNYTGLVFGFGGPVLYQDIWDISMVFRGHYSLTGLTTSGHYPYADENYSVAHYTGDKPTNVLSFQIRVEFCYHIGYFQRAKCDGHVEFLFF